MPRRLRHLLATAALPLFLGIGAPAAPAATPPDTLVMANQIDDMITLDPAEVFEFTAAEWAANVYDRLITYPADDVENLQGHVAESWTISDDGKTFTFQVRPGITFHSGNPLTAEDAAWSLQRVIKLNLTPSFILSQFGLTPENVDEKIQATGDMTFTVELDKPYAPTFFLYCLTATVGSVVDKQLVMEHEADGDMGHEWLKTNAAASGPFKHVAWKPNESTTLEANPDYWKGEAGFARVITRHIGEPATQMLLLEKGDIDIARNLEADQIESLRDNQDIEVKEVPKGAIYYLGLNQKNEHLAKPEVREALKWLIPYEDLESTILKGSATVHQTFLPKGFLGALDETPYSLDIEKAKQILSDAGIDGISLTMDTRNSSPIIDMAQVIQGLWAQAGIDLEILPGDNKQTLTKYRARTHDIYIGRWGPDYQDPHTNADTFASNPGNDEEHTGKLAWRNSWDIPELTEKTNAAVLESDPEKRAGMYHELQRTVLEDGPFVIMFQDIEVIAERNDVEGMIWGPSFDDNKYWQGAKTE